MKPLAWNELKGNWAPILLPYLENESIDYNRLRDEISILIDFAVDGIYTNGTTAEFYNQTEDEFDRIGESTAECCNKAGTPFQIGVSHPSPWISLQRLKRVAALKPSAVQVILPDWSPPNDNEIVDFMQRMAETAAPIGLVLYNPSFAKRVLRPKDWRPIRDAVPNFIGVKTAAGDAAWYEEMRQYAHDVSVFVPGHHLATGIKNGAQGAYSNVACLHPGFAQKWYEQTQTDIEAALEQEKRIQQFMQEYIAPYITQQNYSNQAADRLLANIGGWCDVGQEMRWPYRGIPEEESNRLRPIAKKILPETITNS